ncbi:MAG: three-Cys-motif partner protein TcmP [Acidimicrobiales bacterium]
MPASTTWELPDHSAAKHFLLKKYLEAWYPIMAFMGHGRPGHQLNYIDAFSGPGIYDGGEPGSPIVALRTLIDHESFSSWNGVKFLFYFVEVIPERMASLERQVADLWETREGGQPTNITVTFRPQSFFDLIEELKQVANARSLRPTFAFVDPFGFSGLPLADLCHILSTGSCEVLFNFMYDSVNRFVGWRDQKNQDNFTLLFDGDAHLDLDGKRPEEREAYLHELIGDLIHDSGNFKYVRKFQMERDAARTLYSLFFATRHTKGLLVMKEAMWKVDPTNGERFSDRLVGNPTLFDGVPNYAKLTSILLLKFKSRTAAIEEIEEFTLVDTSFLPKHLREHVLMPLESNGEIEVLNAKPGRQKRHFPPGTLVRFT